MRELTPPTTAWQISPELRRGLDNHPILNTKAFVSSLALAGLFGLVGVFVGVKLLRHLFGKKPPAPNSSLTKI